MEMITLKVLFGQQLKMILGITDIPVSPFIVITTIPPWLLPTPQHDFYLQYKIRNEKCTPVQAVVQQQYWIKHIPQCSIYRWVT